MSIADFDSLCLENPHRLDEVCPDASTRKILHIRSTHIEVAAAEVRDAAELPRLPLQEGTWTFRFGREWRILIVGDGAGAPWTGYQSDLQPGDPAWAALMMLETQWERGAPRGVDLPAFEAGDTVWLHGGDGTLGTITGRPQRGSTGWEYDVVFGARAVRAHERHLVRKQVSFTSARPWLTGDVLSAADVGQLVTLVKLEQPLTDVLYSFGSTRTVFRSYQFKPLLKLMNSATQRLLIADEVGLGKTIEAGLVWAELDRRSGVRRALVVCPASLARKWQAEMKRRFDRDVEIIDRRRLRELIESFRDGRDPRFNAIMSLESIRTAPELDELAELAPRMDLIIVDEAHALRNAGTRSFALGELLSDWADVLLFLSATPLNLGRDDLFNLLNLLSPEDFPDRLVFEGLLEPNQAINRAISLLREPSVAPADVTDALAGLGRTAVGRLVMRRPEFIRTTELLQGGMGMRERSEAVRLLLDLNTLSTVVTRTRKADTPDKKATRSARTIDVDWTESERRLYAAILAWARARALAENGIVGFSTIMPLRQAASCLQASKELLLSRHPILGALEDDFDDVDDLDEEIPSTELGALGQQLSSALAALGDVDTKFDQFLKKLRELRSEGISRVMVFSFFRATLRYLHRRLAPTWQVRVMDGSITSMDERARIMQDFREGLFDVLLVSEVGSEGLDFEFCGALVNYDLPWNPMKVEQRIGRLDRFGQRFEVIHILNFMVPGTIETDIFARLYARIRVFEESIGELEPIIRDEVSEITRVVLDPHRSEQEREREISRIELALEHRRAELGELQAASTSMLSGLDQVLIDGLERATLAQGKYVGESEVEGVLRRFLELHGGELKRPRGAARFHQIIGTPEVVQSAQRALASAEGPMLDRLTSALRDGEPIAATFNPELAMESAADFMTLSHPLVRAAAHHLVHEFAFPNRLGAAAFEGIDPSKVYVTLLAVIEVNGVRPLVELRHPTVELTERTRADDVGALFLARHAQGQIRDPVSVLADIPMEVVDELESLMQGLTAQLELDHRATNGALVDGRELTLRRTYDAKLARARQTLQKLVADGRHESIQRLHRGRIANLTTELELAIAKLESQRSFSVVWRPVGLVLISGR